MVFAGWEIARNIGVASSNVSVVLSGLEKIGVLRGQRTLLAAQVERLFAWVTSRLGKAAGGAYVPTAFVGMYASLWVSSFLSVQGTPHPVRDGW
jgi:hypothetical protein